MPQNLQGECKLHSSIKKPSPNHSIISYTQSLTPLDKGSENVALGVASKYYSEKNTLILIMVVF